jgi:hypothetical protein
VNRHDDEFVSFDSSVAICLPGSMVSKTEVSALEALGYYQGDSWIERWYAREHDILGHDVVLVCDPR